jgi:phosphoribosylformylglycinamidine synthase
MFKAKVNVTLKKSVLDPQGQTVLQALHSLSFKEAKDLRVGKFFELTLEAKSEKDAEEKVRHMCDKLLINPVIEDFQLTVEKI